MGAAALGTRTGVPQLQALLTSSTPVAFHPLGAPGTLPAASARGVLCPPGRRLDWPFPEPSLSRAFRSALHSPHVALSEG